MKGDSEGGVLEEVVVRVRRESASSWKRSAGGQNPLEVAEGGRALESS